MGSVKRREEIRVGFLILEDLSRDDMPSSSSCLRDALSVLSAVASLHSLRSLIFDPNFSIT